MIRDTFLFFGKQKCHLLSGQPTFLLQN